MSDTGSPEVGALDVLHPPDQEQPLPAPWVERERLDVHTIRDDDAPLGPHRPQLRRLRWERVWDCQLITTQEHARSSDEVANFILRARELERRGRDSNPR